MINNNFDVMKFDRINIGEIIKEKVEEKGISASSFAESIGIHRQNVNKTIFDKPTIDTNTLIRISEKLDFNFFQYYKNLDECNKKDDASNEIKEVKAFITLQLGQEKKEEKFTFFFGRDK